MLSTEHLSFWCWSSLTYAVCCCNESFFILQRLNKNGQHDLFKIWSTSGIESWVSDRAWNPGSCNLHWCLIFPLKAHVVASPSFFLGGRNYDCLLDTHPWPQVVASFTSLYEDGASVPGGQHMHFAVTEIRGDWKWQADTRLKCSEPISEHAKKGTIEWVQVLQPTKSSNLLSYNDIVVSWNRGTPKWSIHMGISS